MLEMLYLKALILLYLLSWPFAAADYDQPHQMIEPTPANGSARPSLIFPANGSAGLSVIFPVSGNVYPKGNYYVTMHIGQPSKVPPKPYFLDIDTGSSLTWLQCDAPCKKCTPTPHPHYTPHQHLIVQCKDPICSALNGPKHPCKNPNERCDYHIEYGDHSSSLGFLVRDSFPLQLTNGTTISPLLAFGCGYDQKFPNPNQIPNTDGVLGLGNGKPSILAQLHDYGVTKNVIGHCFSAQGGGYLFFGDALIPASGIIWTPIVSQSNYYSLGPADLQLDGQATVIKGIPIVFDSGTTYTYFSSQPYNALVSMIKSNLNGKNLREVEDGSLPICWKAAKPFRSIRYAVGYFKPLVLSFGNARNVRFQVQPEGYLIVTEHGNVCLGILNGSLDGLGNLNLIGDISLQDKLVIYDNERQQIGWAPSNCNRVPKN